MTTHEIRQVSNRIRLAGSVSADVARKLLTHIDQERFRHDATVGALKDLLWMVKKLVGGEDVDDGVQRMLRARTAIENAMKAWAT